MGTNYYRINPASKEDRENLHKKLDEVLNGNEYRSTFDDMIDDVYEKYQIHICKSSFGWQICFDHNWGKYYQPNRKSLEEFLSEEGTWIEDEYGEKISYEDFWKFVKEHNENPNNKWTSESYRKYEIEKNGRYYSGCCSEDIENCKAQFGIDSHGESDFEVDGLRFAVYSDFS